MLNFIVLKCSGIISAAKQQDIQALMNKATSPEVFSILKGFVNRHGNFSQDDIKKSIGPEKEAKELFNQLNHHRGFYNARINNITTDDEKNGWKPTKSWENLKEVFAEQDQETPGNESGPSNNP
jgi:hypothetical protein